MSKRIKRVAIALSALAALAIAGLLLWLFSLEGTLGLSQWHPPWRRNFVLIGIAGILPSAFAIASLSRRRSAAAWTSATRKPGAPRKQGAALAAVAIGLSALALSIAGGLFYYVLSSATASAAPGAAIRLVDPDRGLAPVDGVLRLSLSADPHYGQPDSNAIARRSIIGGVADARPRRDAFLILGDNVEMGMDDSYWRQEAADLAQLGPMPVVALLGNHDGLVGGQFHYRDYFMPASAKTDSGSPYYYSMDAGVAQIVVIELLWGTESFSAAQSAWLEKTLSALPAGKQVVVLSHCFIYASGYIDEYGLDYFDNPDAIARIAPILERHKVALVVSGHDHDMELLRRNGVTYAVIGAMGGRLDPEPSYHSPASIWFRAGTFGRIDLDIRASGMSLAFKDATGAALREDYIPAAD